jgi:hypothetical protein
MGVSANSREEPVSSLNGLRRWVGLSGIMRHVRWREKIDSWIEYIELSTGATFIQTLDCSFLFSMKLAMEMIA